MSESASHPKIGPAPKVFYTKHTKGSHQAFDVHTHEALTLAFPNEIELVEELKYCRIDLGDYDGKGFVPEGGRWYDTTIIWRKT